MNVLIFAAKRLTRNKQAYRRRYASPGVLRVHDPEQALLLSPSGVSRIGHHVEKEEGMYCCCPVRV
jgi:hypothetical protein